MCISPYLHEWMFIFIPYTIIYLLPDDASVPSGIIVWSVFAFSLSILCIHMIVIKCTQEKPLNSCTLCISCSNSCVNNTNGIYHPEVDFSYLYTCGNLQLVCIVWRTPYRDHFVVLLCTAVLKSVFKDSSTCLQQ